jgi:hypothetical protein
VPGHEVIVGYETADKFARTGPEPACGISIGAAKRAVRDWTNRNKKSIGNKQLDSSRQKDLYKGPLPEE